MTEIENLKKLKAYIKNQIEDIPTWEDSLLAAVRIDELQSIETLIDVMIDNSSD